VPPPSSDLPSPGVLANAVVPQSVRAGKREVVGLDQVQVYDGGASGVPGSSDASLFLDEGVFIP
jgi:hypothetical protein